MRKLIKAHPVHTVAVGFLLLFLLYVAGIFLFPLFHLAYRRWVNIAFFILAILLLLYGVVLLCKLLIRLILKKQKTKWLYMICKAIGVIGFIAVFVFLYFVWQFSMLIIGFGFPPEHVVMKNGEKMVAEVNSFLEVNVTYYDYENFFFRGAIVRGDEWYGSGGYDPFLEDFMPTPKSYYYYDEEGKLIDSSLSQEDTTSQDTTTSDAPKEEASVDDEENLPHSSYSSNNSFPPYRMQCRFENGMYSDKGSMLSYSVDGTNWEEHQIGYNYTFLFGKTGYLVFSFDWAMNSEAASIYRTDDGGKTWTFIADAPSDDRLADTNFFDENIGYLQYGTPYVDSYHFYLTTDGAKTFKEVTPPIEVQENRDLIQDYLYKNYT